MLFNGNYFSFYFLNQIIPNYKLGFLARLYTLEQARDVYKSLLEDVTDEMLEALERIR